MIDQTLNKVNSLLIIFLGKLSSVIGTGELKCF